MSRAASLLLLILPSLASAQTPAVPPPIFDRIDYKSPAKYLVLEPTLGRAESLRAVAAQLDGVTAEDKLRAVSSWMGAHLQTRTEAPYDHWRDFDEILKSGYLISCADTAVVFGALARAAGVPAVWVKAMDADWVRAYRNGTAKTWVGHVFVEVYLRDKWALVDVSQSMIYDDYDPKSHLLPGNRYAYDKGGEPFSLILSMRAELWREQTGAFFKTLDLSLLPIGGGHPLKRTVSVVGDPALWPLLTARSHALGREVVSGFSRNFDHWLANAAGQFLIITVTENNYVLPPEYRDKYAPLPDATIEAALRDHASGYATRLLPDGTHVILLYGRDAAAIGSEIARLTLSD